MFPTLLRPVIALAVLIALPGLAAAERVALVIGNSGYANAPRLENPANDAEDIAAALETVGFAVERRSDLDYEDTRRALAAFTARAEKADVAVIYFAGHGIEIDRRNYLLPVDADLQKPVDVTFQALDLAMLRRAAEPARDLSLVIVDACRNNPFLDRMETGTRSISRGLGRVTPRGKNRIVAFAAKEGTIAEDGDGRNSPYAAALKRALTEPGLEIGKLFRRVRDEVLEATNNRQEPVYYGSLSYDDFYFVAPTRVVHAEGEAVGAAEPMAEVAFWMTIAESRDARDFDDYLTRYPDGRYASIAERRRADLRAADAEPEPRIAIGPGPAGQGEAAPDSDLPPWMAPGGIGGGQPEETPGSDHAGVSPPVPGGGSDRPPSEAPEDSAAFPCIALEGGPCIQPEPVGHADLMDFVDAVARTHPDVLLASDAVMRGFDGVAEDVPLWLARRYAAWLGARLGQPICVADSAALAAGASLPRAEYLPSGFRELAGDVCERFETYDVAAVIEWDPASGQSVTRCVHEFEALPGQAFRLMRAERCE